MSSNCTESWIHWFSGSSVWFLFHNKSHTVTTLMPSHNYVITSIQDLLFLSFLSYIWLLWLNYCILNDSKTRFELKICLLPPAWLWVQSLFNNLLFCDEILKNVSSLTVSEELFLQRTARCRAVIPSLVLKSRWAPPLRSTLISSQLSSSWTASVRGHSETQTQDLILLWK